MYLPIADDEIPAVADLMNRAYRGAGAPSGWSNETQYLAGDRTTADLLRTDLAAKPAASLLKWVDEATDRLRGSVWLEPINENTWYLGSLAIDPDQQNGGLGRVMLAAAEQWVQQQGGKRVRMTVVNVRDSLIAWYIRRGYHKTGQTEPFPYGDDRFGKPLRDDLCFVELMKDLTPAAE